MASLPKQLPVLLLRHTLAALLDNRTHKVSSKPLVGGGYLRADNLGSLAQSRMLSRPHPFS
jgi:hypothetical protein